MDANTHQKAVFCRNCGTKLAENAIFCTQCGAPQQPSAGQGNPGGPQSNGAPPHDHRSVYERGFFSSLWHSHAFGWAAVKFNRTLHYIGFFIYLASLIFLDKWGFDWVWKSGCILGMIFSVVTIYRAHKHQRSRLYTHCPNCNRANIKIGTKFCPTCGTAIPVQTIEPEDLESACMDGTIPDAKNSAAAKQELNKQKRYFLVSIAVGIIALGVLASGVDVMAWVPIYEIKNIELDDSEYDTIGEAMDDLFSDPSWSAEKKGSDAYLVFVEGYVSELQQEVRIEFYYEDQVDDTFNYKFNAIELLQDGKRYTSLLDLMFLPYLL